MASGQRNQGRVDLGGKRAGRSTPPVSGHHPRGPLAWACLLLTAGLLAACPDPETGAPPPPVIPVLPLPEPALYDLTVEEDSIQAADGTVLLQRGDLPSEIAVSDGVSFGASQRFVAAALAPDDTWLAVISTGAAHAAGWLSRTGSRELQPAAFQYGGELALGPWSEDGRYLVFLHRGPAGGQTLSVVDRRGLAATVSDHAMAVTTPDQGEREPEQVQHDVLGWDAGRLLFVDGEQRWRFDPDTADVEAVD